MAKKKQQQERALNGSARVIKRIPYRLSSIHNDVSKCLLSFNESLNQSDIADLEQRSAPLAILSMPF